MRFLDTRKHRPNVKRIASALIEHGRASEWLTSSVMLAFALVLAVPGDTMTGRGFSMMVRMGFDEATVAVPLALVGSARLAALYINGNWRRSPMLRRIGATVGSTFFAMLGMAFLWPSLEVGSPVSTAVSTYFVLSIFDGLAAYRSGADARLARPVSRA